MLVYAYSFVNEIIFETLLQDFFRKTGYIHIKKGWRPAYTILCIPFSGIQITFIHFLYRNDCLELIAVNLNIKFSSQCFRIGTYDCKSQSVTLTGSCLVAS